MTDSNRPRHSLDDDSFDEAFAFDDTTDADHYGDYDDDFNEAEYQATGGAGSTRAAGNGNNGGGVPIRGLAMILLAVAIVLIGWGAFSFLSGGDDSNDQASDNNAQTSQEQSAGGQTQQSAPSGDAQQSGAAAPSSDAAAGEQSEAAGAGVGNEGQQGATAEGQVNKADQQVTVLNNSPISGLAGDTAKGLRDKQWGKTSFGNLPDTTGAFPNSVVLYPQDDANARAAAEQLASDLGIRAETRNAEIDKQLASAKMLEGQGPAAVVVITTNDMPR